MTAARRRPPATSWDDVLAALPGSFTGRPYWAEPSGGASSASRGPSASPGPAWAGTATGSVAVEYLTQPHSRWSQYLPGLSPTSPRVPRRINLVHRFARIGLLQSGWPVGETDPERCGEAEDRDQHQRHEPHPRWSGARHGRWQCPSTGIGTQLPRSVSVPTTPARPRRSRDDAQWQGGRLPRPPRAGL